MAELQELYHLQELDVQAEAKNAALQEIASSLGETGELVTARAQVDSLRELLHDQERRLRELEWDSEEITRHIAADEQKLYGGNVRNPKELDGLQKDAEQRRRHLREIEDRELQLMADVEATQAELARAQAELARVWAAWEDAQRALSARQAEESAALAALKVERAKVTAMITGPMLAEYERLRREKRGRAISRIERSNCQGCRIALPSGIIAHARAGRDLVYCPSCGRLLMA